MRLYSGEKFIKKTEKKSSKLVEKKQRNRGYYIEKKTDLRKTRKF